MEFLTYQQVADMFPGKNRKTIDNWLNTGVLPKKRLTIKIGGSSFFVKEELEKFLAEKRLA